MFTIFISYNAKTPVLGPPHYVESPREKVSDLQTKSLKDQNSFESIAAKKVVSHINSLPFYQIMHYFVAVVVVVVHLTLRTL